MSTTAPEPQATAEATTDPNAAPPPATPAQEPDWKAEARKWETRAKENKTAADELAALKASQMTEAEKQAKALADAQATIAKYETEKQVTAWKAEVSQATGVPADALAGTTLEEIQSHAAVLTPLIAKEPPRKGALGPYVPGEGATPTGTLGGPAQEFADYISGQLGH